MMLMAVFMTAAVMMMAGCLKRANHMGKHTPMAHKFGLNLLMAADVAMVMMAAYGHSSDVSIAIESVMMMGAASLLIGTKKRVTT